MLLPIEGDYRCFLVALACYFAIQPLPLHRREHCIPLCMAQKRLFDTLHYGTKRPELVAHRTNSHYRTTYRQEQNNLLQQQQRKHMRLHYLPYEHRPCTLHF